jgi:hypothetical protein
VAALVTSFVFTGDVLDVYDAAGATIVFFPDVAGRKIIDKC